MIIRVGVGYKKNSLYALIKLNRLKNKIKFEHEMVNIS